MPLKLSALLLFTALLTVACKNADRQARDTRGEPKNMPRPAAPPMSERTEYLVDSTGKRQLHLLERYNEQGQLIFTAAFLSNGDTAEIHYITPGKGRDKPIAEITIDKIKRRQLEEKFSYVKDTILSRVDWAEKDADGEIGNAGYRVYEQDKDGKPLRMTFYMNGAELGKQVMRRDYMNGLPVEEAMYQLMPGTDSILKTKTSYAYDSIGRLVAQVNAGQQGVESMERYEYDSLNNRILEISNIPAANFQGELEPYVKLLNTFNKYGEIVQSSMMLRDKLNYAIYYTYDDYGNLRRERRVWPGGKTEGRDIEIKYRVAK